MNLQRYSADAGHIMEGKTELNLTDAEFEAQGGIEMDGMAWSEFFFLSMSFLIVYPLFLRLHRARRFHHQ